MVVLVNLWLATACNVSLWLTLSELPDVSGMRGGVFAVVLALIIASAGSAPFINPTGNPLLATAGTGDVLAGWIGSLWAQGLRAMELVHNQGTCLSQAFARNLVRCPDGVVGYVDFEDDPTAVLPLPL